MDEQDHRGHDVAVGLAVCPGEVLEHAHFFASGLLAQVGEHIAELGLGGHFGELDAGLVLERAVGKDGGELLGGGVGLLVILKSRDSPKLTRSMMTSIWR